MLLSRARAALLAAAVAVSAMLLVSGGSPAAAADRPYLALGDSVVFGYITQDAPAYVNANNFIGYPSYVGQMLDLAPTNASCPGEASGGFQDPTGNDNGCRTNYRAHGFPLHVNYSGTQLAFATSFLKSHPKTKLVTLGLGANDFFLLQGCTTPQCLPDGLAVMSANIGAILKAIRGTGYRGVLEVVNYYSLDYADPMQVAGTEGLNHFVTASAKANGAVVADAFTAFQTAAASHGMHTCGAGLLNGSPSSDTMCDVHPSQTGQQILAEAVDAAYVAAGGH
ncbi:MAG: SGNH/GDSL hydrolase family protein [Candidatus Dormibacteraceae bacterium]